MNVAHIQELAENGNLTGAEEALDNLLEMGPHNLEALKLRARLYEVSGRFSLESKMWERIARISRDDHDLLDYLTRRQVEDRENFYFTDSIPGGGKRFLAFPRRMVKAATIGLVGCLLFLTFTRLGQVIPIINQPIVMLGCFIALVIIPWFAIMVSYSRSLRFISVTPEGVDVATRFKTYQIPRSEIERVCLAHDDKRDTWRLMVVLIPNNRQLPCLELDFNEATTSIRARSYFIKELIKFYGEPHYMNRSLLVDDLKNRTLIRG